jgi:cobalt-zinc-cadmium efflux system outer membrane protein
MLICAISTVTHGQQTLSLHDAITAAVNSPTVQIADGQVDASRGMLRQAALGPNPRLYLQSEDLRPWADDFTFSQKTEDYGYVGQTLEIDGKRRKRVAVASANLDRSTAERQLRMQQSAGYAAAAYWTAVADERIATLLQQDLAAVDEMVRYHKERVDAGAMRGVDLIRIQIERDRIYLSLEAAERDAELARIDLSRQIGRNVPHDTALTDDLMAVPEIPRVDLQTALAQRKAAEADIKLQRAIGVPNPDLLAGYKRNAGADTAYASLQIDLPFRNRNQGEIARAEAQLRISQARLEQTRIVVRAEIDAANENYQREMTIVRQPLPDMREHAKQNLAILSEAYRIGGVDLLRYIDAERTSIDVEVTALRTLAGLQQAALRLQLAYGVQP